MLIVRGMLFIRRRSFDNLWLGGAGTGWGRRSLSACRGLRSSAGALLRVKGRDWFRTMGIVVLVIGARTTVSEFMVSSVVGFRRADQRTTVRER